MPLMMMVMMMYGRFVLRMHTYISIFINTYMYNAQSEFAAVCIRTVQTHEHRRSCMGVALWGGHVKAAVRTRYAASPCSSLQLLSDTDALAQP